MEEKETVREPYRMVLEGGQAELVEKKSRFIANVRPVESEAEAVAFIDASKIGTMRYGVRLKICTDYNGIGKIQYILRQNGLEAEDTVYTDQVELTVLLAAECVPGLKKEITEATAAKAGIEEVEKLYFVAPDA